MDFMEQVMTMLSEKQESYYMIMRKMVLVLLAVTLVLDVVLQLVCLGKDPPEIQVWGSLLCLES